VPVNNGDGSITITLNANLTGAYFATSQLGTSPTFTNLKSAGVGVVTSGDDFWAADPSRLAMPYDEAFVDFFVAPDGQRALPYIGKEFFDAAKEDDKGYLSETWFQHYRTGATGVPDALQQNYFHLLGAANITAAVEAFSLAQQDWTYVFVAKLQGGTTEDVLNRVRSTTNHEFGHHFGTNEDDCEGHDTNGAWCLLCGGAVIEPCLMNSPRSDREDGIDRLDTKDLLTGAPTGGTIICGSPPVPRNYNKGDGAIRTIDDPQ